MLHQLCDQVPSQRRLHLHRCVHVQVPASWGWQQPRLIEDYHLLYIRRGGGGYGVEGHSFEFRPGTVIFIGSGVRQSAWQTPGAPPEIISVRFGLYQAGQPYRRLIQVPDAKQAFQFQGDQQTEQLFGLLPSLYRQQAESESSSLLHVLLGHLDRLYRARLRIGQEPVAKTRQHDGSTITGALDPASIRTASNRPIPSYAHRGRNGAMASLSRNYFVRLFQQEIGTSPKHIKLHHGCALPDTSSKTVKRVCTRSPLI